MTSSPADAAPQRASGSGRVWLLNAGLAAAAGAIYLGAVQGTSPVKASIHIPWWLLGVLFFIAESAVVHIQFRRDSESFSLSEIPLVLGLFFTGPRGLIAAQLVGSALALATRRRQRPVKIAFNVANLGLQTVLAAALFGLVVDPSRAFGVSGWVASFVSVTTGTALGVGAVVAVISLVEGVSHIGMVPRVMGVGVAVAVANTSLALLGVSILELDPRAVWLLAVPAATVFLSYRAYTTQRQKQQSLEVLSKSTGQFQSSLAELDTSVLEMLEQARRMFRAEIASITLFPSADEPAAIVFAAGPGEAVSPRHTVALDPTQGVWARVASEGRAVLLPRPIRNERLREWFATQGIADAMVAPLRAESGIVGTMLVGNRLGDVSTFTAEDLQLMETFANHASVTLENVRLVQRLQKALDRQTELNRMKDEFVATVSHELRTPLTSIQGFVKTLLRPGVSPGPEEMHGYLEIIDRQGTRLRGLIEDLLMVSKIESRQHHTRPASVWAPALAQQVVDEFFARSSGRTMRLLFDPGFPSVMTDEESLRRIVANYVDNALKYAPAGTVTIAGRVEDGGVTVSVVDEGTGIPAAAQDHIWDRFYQADSSATRKVGGTGLGLYICRQLAELIDGRVWLERTGADGSVFSVWIPSLPARSSGTPAPAAVPTPNPLWIRPTG